MICLFKFLSTTLNSKRIGNSVSQNIKDTITMNVMRSSKFKEYEVCDLMYITRTTDAQRGNSLHCTAENSLPLPNF